MNMKRFYYGLGVIICITVLLLAVYLEYYENLAPCSLCQLQRLLIAIIGILFLIAWFKKLKRKGLSFYGFSILLLCLGGISLAGKQIYFQFFPDKASINCSASLNYLLKVLPITDALKTMIIGSGNCGEVMWRLFGMSLPEWSMAAFLLLGILALLPLRDKKQT